MTLGRHTASHDGDATRTWSHRRIVCPAALEFGPCAAADSCREMLQLRLRQGQTLLDCVDACRKRAAAAGGEGIWMRDERGLEGSRSDGSYEEGGLSESGLEGSSSQEGRERALTGRGREDAMPAGPSSVASGGATSWEEIRARHRASRAGETTVADEVEGDGAAAPPAGGATRRKKKNRYGDEME